LIANWIATKVCFLVQLLLNFAAWSDLTSNADNSIISVALKVKEHIQSAPLKPVDDLWVYQGFMMSFNHQAAIQGTFKQCLRY